MPLKDLTPEQTADINKRFTYHPPKPDQIERYGLLRAKVRELAEVIVSATPSGREQATALTLLTQVSMMANAAIAIGED